MAERDNFNEEDQQRKEAQRLNSVEPVPHRGEDQNLEDADPEHRNKVSDAFKDEVGKSNDNNEDSRTDTDAGSRHGMGNKQ